MGRERGSGHEGVTSPTTGAICHRGTHQRKRKKKKKLLINVICQYAFAPRDWSRSITWHLLCHLPHLAKPLHPSPGPESRVNTAGCQAVPGLPARGRASLPPPRRGLGLASSVGDRSGSGLPRDRSVAFREQRSEVPTSPRRRRGKKKVTRRHGEPAAGWGGRTWSRAHPRLCSSKGEKIIIMCFKKQLEKFISRTRAWLHAGETQGGKRKKKKKKRKKR